MALSVKSRPKLQRSHSSVGGDSSAATRVSSNSGCFSTERLDLILSNLRSSIRDKKMDLDTAFNHTRSDPDDAKNSVMHRTENGQHYKDLNASAAKPKAAGKSSRGANASGALQRRVSFKEDSDTYLYISEKDEYLKYMNKQAEAKQFPSTNSQTSIVPKSALMGTTDAKDYTDNKSTVQVVHNRQTNSGSTSSATRARPGGLARQENRTMRRSASVEREYGDSDLSERSRTNKVNGKSSMMLEATIKNSNNNSKRNLSPKNGVFLSNTLNVGERKTGEINLQKPVTKWGLLKNGDMSRFRNGVNDAPVTSPASTRRHTSVTKMRDSKEQPPTRLNQGSIVSRAEKHFESKVSNEAARKGNENFSIADKSTNLNQQNLQKVRVPQKSPMGAPGNESHRPPGRPRLQEVLFSAVQPSGEVDEASEIRPHPSSHGNITITLKVPRENDENQLKASRGAPGHHVQTVPSSEYQEYGTSSSAGLYDNVFSESTESLKPVKRVQHGNNAWCKLSMKPAVTSGSKMSEKFLAAKHYGPRDSVDDILQCAVDDEHQGTSEMSETVNRGKLKDTSLKVTILQGVDSSQPEYLNGPSSYMTANGTSSLLTVNSGGRPETPQINHQTVKHFNQARDQNDILHPEQRPSSTDASRKPLSEFERRLARIKNVVTDAPSITANQSGNTSPNPGGSRTAWKVRSPGGNGPEPSKTGFQASSQGKSKMAGARTRSSSDSADDVDWYLKKDGFQRSRSLRELSSGLPSPSSIRCSPVRKFHDPPLSGSVNVGTWKAAKSTVTSPQSHYNQQATLPSEAQMRSSSRPVPQSGSLPRTRHDGSGKTLSGRYCRLLGENYNRESEAPQAPQRAAQQDSRAKPGSGLRRNQVISNSNSALDSGSQWQPTRSNHGNASATGRRGMVDFVVYI